MPNTETPKTQTQPKKVAEPIYTYAVSWKWLLGGLLCLFAFCGIAGGWYFVQTFNMSAQILDTAAGMVKEADQKNARINEVSDPAERAKLRADSLKLRRSAADLLNNYRRTNSRAPNEVVLKKLYDILDSLYKEEGEGTTRQGLWRGEQLSAVAVALINTVPEEASIDYRVRLLELEWDRPFLPGVISRGKELLTVSQTLGDPENYEALRYIALACFEQIPQRPYNPFDYQLPSVFPEAMDELLKKLNTRKPEDIEIAKRYAEFIISLDHPQPERRGNFRACASEPLTNKTPRARVAEARACIDKMVSLNKADSTAYLTRYHFITEFLSSDSEAMNRAGEDLKTVLNLTPNHAEGLILSSSNAIRQASDAADAGKQAAESGEPERAQEFEKQAESLKKQAEDFLRRTVKYNPSDSFGYQYLGDYLLAEKRLNEAVAVWNEGLNISDSRGNEELIGRLVTVLLEQRQVDQVREKLESLQQTIADMRFSRSEAAVARTVKMQQLLTAQLYLAEANIAASKVDVAQQRSEIQRLAGIVQQKKGAAIQEFDGLLRTFGSNESDYIIERESVYWRLLPQALLQAGELKLDWGEWDSAAMYFSRALRFPSSNVQRLALLGMSLAYQQGNNLEGATQALKVAADANPQDTPLRYAYATLLFRTQMASNTASAESLDALRREFALLRERSSEMPQPWAVDIRLIHIGVARANLSNDAQTILDAMREAAKKFRTLESQAFPPEKDGKARTYKNYIDDPAFVAEMVGIYSSLSERADFDRLLEKLREFPDGEDAYYEARISDCLRRGDNSGAAALIDEAGASTQLSAAKRERFAALLQSLKGGNMDTADNLYNQLKTTFDESPESLKPQAFFLLADMSLDRGNIEQAQRIRDRLKKIEGTEGTYWRYITVRIMLDEEDPDYAELRRIQEEVAKYRPDWDKTYILRILIEERYLEADPGVLETRDELIRFYREAIRCGNLQAEVWQRLSEHLESAGLNEDAKDVYRDAARRGVMLEARTGQLPQPYGRMYSQVQEALANEDASSADRIAQQCIVFAERRGERPELIFTLNLILGKVFLDSQMYDSAARHLTETARRGSIYVTPLALCNVKSGKVDEGFTLLLNEIDIVPSSMLPLLSAILLLLDQAQPSEEVYERIDRLMNRIERGSRLTLSGKVENFEGGIPIGSSSVGFRRILSLVVRFPEKTGNLDPSMLQFFSPEDWEAEEPGE